MPAIADQVATIEHDLSVALANLDSVRSENAQLKTALSSLQTEHVALQARHSEAVSLFDETRQHAQAVATAALTMLKVSRPQAGPVPASEGTKALQAMVISQQDMDAMKAKQAQINEAASAAIAEAVEPEKTDVRPELPIIDQAQQSTDLAGGRALEPVQGDSGDEQPFEVGSVDKAPLPFWRGNQGDTINPPGEWPVTTRSVTLDLSGFTPEMQDALHADAEKLSQLTGQDHSVTFLADEIPNTDRLRAHMPAAEPMPIFLKRQQTTGVLG